MPKLMSKSEDLTSIAVIGIDKNVWAIVIADGKTPEFRDVQFAPGIIPYNPTPDYRDSYLLT